MKLMTYDPTALDYFDKVKREEYSSALICGIDEAGRGPLAGDVYAAAVVFDNGVFIEGLNDSKKLSEKEREALFGEIIKKSSAYCISSASVEEIETLNILGATMLAMKRAFDGLNVAGVPVLTDGNRLPDLGGEPSEAIVKGDMKSACIAAASILAKVSRDRYMKELSEKYPEYMFEKHKGYPTALHYEALKKYGASPVHRKLFVSNFMKRKESDGK